MTPGAVQTGAVQTGAVQTGAVQTGAVQTGAVQTGAVQTGAVRVGAPRIRRLLIANRGEIAARVIRTCARLGIESVLAASDADLDALPARLADRVVRLGPAPATASYLDATAVVRAAQAIAADAVHPGYGFLSENPVLARACADAEIVFVGPSAESLEAVGDKLRARAHAVAAGLPVVPGGEAADLAGARAVAAEVGYPLLVKAVSGGGGRGMKLVASPDELSHTLDLAMSEAAAAFGDPRVYLERFVESGRHVEVQVLGDGTRAVALGDRDCSVQRRYQKLFEEAPAPQLSEGARAGMAQAALALAEHLRYRGLGTVELLHDRERDSFYFLEMNARIQVEHPVTEMVTGLDLVAEQLAVAEGMPLRLRQEEIVLSGHAVECRINAEDWAHDFRPSPGRIDRVVLPVGDGIRVDTHVQGGSVVPPYYDSLLAKLVVHGRDRDDALARARAALQLLRIEGVTTTVPVHQLLLADPEFAAGGVDTAFFERFLTSHRPSLVEVS
ncbi:acetyl-CoA carboxylase biotin carboxylase subunit [Pseudonocardia aurantiaca]|uniref:biotin carboxylase n=1 Tax=Pseudonocardia aurantiaca TaxID=75290 RepID=A0ABW4FH81_9PSEU